jgi:hypothetical protein
MPAKMYRVRVWTPAMNLYIMVVPLSGTHNIEFRNRTSLLLTVSLVTADVKWLMPTRITLMVTTKVSFIRNPAMVHIYNQDTTAITVVKLMA